MMSTFHPCLHFASWVEIPLEIQKSFIKLTGKDEAYAKSFYELYFYWYNVAHEMGHILRKHHGTRSNNHWIEETSVNEFAVAYWSARGEKKRLGQLKELLGKITGSLPNPVPENKDESVYFDTHYAELTQDLIAYSYFQLNMTLRALKKNLRLLDVLKKLITPKARPASPIKPRPYPKINVDLPPIIVRDIKNFLSQYEVKVPEVKLVREFRPNIQFVTYS